MQKIESISVSLNNLLLKFDGLKNENISLKIQNEALKAKLTELEGKLSGTEEQFKIFKMARSLDGNGINEDKTEIKRKINEFIREIDHCLAMMNV